MNEEFEECVSLDYKIFDLKNETKNNPLFKLKNETKNNPPFILNVKINGLIDSKYSASTQTPLTMEFDKLPKNLIELFDNEKFLLNYIICLEEEEIFNVEISLTDYDRILQEQKCKIKRDDVIKYFNNNNNNNQI